MATRPGARIRARMKGDVADIQLLISHPMETGRRKDPETGLRVPRHFIREIHCLHNGEEVLAADWSWGIARDPYLSYQVAHGAPGEEVKIRWTDDQGINGSLETLVE